MQSSSLILGTNHAIVPVIIERKDFVPIFAHKKKAGTQARKRKVGIARER